MPLRNNFERQISLMRGLKEMLSAYEEISVMRIGRVRGHVLATRTFREGLLRIFSEVRASRHAEIEKILRRPPRRILPLHLKVGIWRRGKETNPDSRLPITDPMPQRPREAAVLLSSNQKLSGGITQSLFRRFLEHIDKTKPEAVVVAGVVGRELLRQARPKLAFKYFKLPGEHAPLREHKAMVRFLRKFSEVNLFYGKFVNVVDQIAATARITSAGRLAAAASPGTPPARPEGGRFNRQNDLAAPNRNTDYLFEPELPAVLDFFDTQVFALLFQQTISESSLAILGSRITAMEAATANVERRLGKMLAAQQQAHKDARSRKQRQMLAGISLWGI